MKNLNAFGNEIRFGNIAILDFYGSAGVKCKCGNEALFLLSLFQTNQIYLCDKCLSDITHCSIDALR
jgi:hypothetical protein